MEKTNDDLKFGKHEFSSRLLLGTGKFSSAQVLEGALRSAESQLVTVALRRMRRDAAEDELVSAVARAGLSLLPNTSGARTAKEAVLAAELARDLHGTDLLKLEIHPDQRYLMPDAVETFLAAEQLVGRGFTVLPYVHADPALCKRLEEVGCAAVMPLAAPIGTNAGLQMREMLRIIIAESKVPVVVDAGIGAPSHAAECMEMGAAAVLVNTAIATSRDPVAMAAAFRECVTAGRNAYLAGLGARETSARPTSPMEFLFAE